MDNLLAFFGLREDPFRLTPDPHFYFPSRVHQEALHSLEYIIKNREGFYMITGEPGTGKTTLINVFREKWKERAEIALILTPRLTPDDFLVTVFEALQLQTVGKNKNDLFRELKDLLIEKYFAGRFVIIIVDEAHNLPTETLEELRLLSNLETNKEKLVQIVLIGQPELENRLAHEQLRQLDQRITERIRLQPLTLQESAAYIGYRLGKAGKNNVRLSARALRRVYRFSRGIPRLINLVLSRTIMAAYIDHDPSIHERHIIYAIQYLAGRRTKRKRAGYKTTAFALIALLVLSLGVFGLVHVFSRSESGKDKGNANREKESPVTTISSSTIPLEPHAAAIPEQVVISRHPVYATVKYDTVNVRSAPSREAPRIGFLYKGTRIALLEKAQDTDGTIWHKVFEYEKGSGWVSQEVLSLEGDANNPS